MPVSQLTDEEQAIVRRCIEAVRGGLIPEVEIHTVTGLRPHELDEVLAAWPHPEVHPEGELAINNCLVNSWGYPVPADTWARWFPVPRAQVRLVYDKWRQLRGEPAVGRHFDAIQ